MSFAFNEEQELFRNSVARFVEDNASSEAVRKAADSEAGYDPKIWQQIVELGFAALVIPEEYDGLGLGQVEQSIILGGLGGALLPSPLFATTLAARAIMLAATPDQQKRWLPEIAAGSQIAAVVLDRGDMEQGAKRGSDAPRLVERDGRKLLSGKASPVPFGHVADLLVVAADDAGKTRFVAVPRTRTGMKAERASYLDFSRPVAAVEFQDVAVEEDELFPITGEGVLTRLLAYANASLAAELVESANQSLALTVDYTSQRIQFGRPIGSFQAVKHMLADVAVAAEAAESAVWYAASTADQKPDEFIEAAAVAKLLGSAAARKSAAEMLQLHGGIGFTWEHDAHLRLRHARAAAGLYGRPEAQQDIIFAAMLKELGHAA